MKPSTTYRTKLNTVALSYMNVYTMNTTIHSTAHMFYYILIFVLLGMIQLHA